MISGEQDFAEAVKSSELHRSVLEFDGEAVDVELHVKLHVREKPLEKSSNREREGLLKLGKHFTKIPA